ncbi:TPA: DUF2514 family protein [Citrobacter farmeri]
MNIALVEKYWKPLAVISLVTIAFIAGNVWSDRGWEKKWAERDSAESSQTAISAQVITSNVLTTMSIFNTITEANRYAKEQSALDASGASANIQAAVANDDCTDRPVPSGAVKRLQQYANGLRQSTGSAVAGEPDS